MIGHLKFGSIDGDAGFDVHSMLDVEFELELVAMVLASIKFDLDELRPRPNFRNEKRGRKPNVELSQLALRLKQSPFALFASLFVVDTIRLLVFCFRLFFFNVPES